MLRRLNRAFAGFLGRVKNGQKAGYPQFKPTTRFASVAWPIHHQQARALVERYDLLVVEDLRIANMLRRAKPVPDPDNPGRYLADGARAKSGLNRSIVTPAGAGSSRFCAPKRKRLGAS